MENHTTIESEESLWRRFKELDDQKAFRLLIDPHREIILAYLIRLIGSPEDAMDVLQETLIRFARKFDPAKASVKTFLFCIAINQARTLYRQRKRKREEPLQQRWNEIETIEQSADSYKEEEKYLLFHDALNQLPIKERETIELKDIEGLKYKEAARILECTEKRFDKRLQKARKHLREILQTDETYALLTENFQT